MRRLVKITLTLAGFVVGVPLLCLVLVVAAANTDAGRYWLGWAVAYFTGGKVTVADLSGRFPDRLRVGRIAVGDTRGTWLVIEHARLDWSPLRLIDGEVRIQALTAAHVAIARRPESTDASPGGPSAGENLPLAINIDAFGIERVDIASLIAGAPATLRINGNFQLASWSQGSVALEGDRLDSPGSYKLSGAASPDRLTVRIDVTEPEHGLVARLAGLPDLGPLSATASLDGPRNAEKAGFTATAGPLQTEGHGTVDLIGKSLDLDLIASAARMTPRSDLGWQSASLEAHVHGPFASPSATGRLDIDRLTMAGASVDRLSATIDGKDGAVRLNASATKLRIPGPSPDLFAAAPVELHAQAMLNAAPRLLRFTLSHPLLSASGTIDADGQPTGSVLVTVPSLAPFAAVAALDLDGHATATAKFARQGDAVTVGVDGIVGITGGLPTVAGLLGDNAAIALTAAVRGGDLTLGNFAINGKALSVSATGARTGGIVDLDWQATLPDLSIVATSAAGRLSAQGHVGGPLPDLSVTAQLEGDASVAGLPQETFTATLAAQGLPTSPSVTIEAQGRLAGAPLQLAGAASRQADGTLALSLDRLQWKSATGEGKLTLAPGSLVPLGRLQLRLAQLGDLAPLTGLVASGSFEATLDTVEQQGKEQVRLHAAARRVVYGATGADRLTLDAEIADPTARPVVAATLAADGLRQGAIAGTMRLMANGPFDALGLKLSSDLRTPQGPATVSAVADARVLGPGRRVHLSSLDAAFGGATARLLAPARIDLANGVAVDHLRVGISGATIALAGRLTPTLDLKVSASNITPAIAAPWAPGFKAAGTVTLSGDLRGTLAAPEGRLHLTGRGLRALTGTVGALPPTNIDATATLVREAAQIDAHVGAGRAVRLRLSGTVPLRPANPFVLRLDGDTDLAILDPVLTANGRAARGQATIALGLGGTLAAPQITGMVRLANGSVQDFVQGIHISDLHGVVRAGGSTLQIDQFDGRAGSGTVSVGGTLGLLQPGLPISMTVTARNARLLASDLLSATGDVDLALHGESTRNLAVDGKIHIAKATINVPDSLPQSVAVLNVRRLGAKPVAPPAPGPSIGLALTIDAPGQVFVRGRGLDAEMGGRLKIGGTAAAPVIDGGFTLRRGTFSLAGQTLSFTKGKVAFGGAGLYGKLDPSLDFVAETSTSALTATLTVTGYADAPKLQLSSAPELPQDEILSQLLFGQSAQRLGPFQLAAIAQAAASFGGVGGSDPLAAVRGRLGLDRLSVSAASRTGKGATVEAGKYVANGVYVGAKQGTSGGSQAQVQIDLTKHLKLQTTLGTGGTPATGITPDNDPGSSIGLTYGFEY